MIIANQNMLKGNEDIYKGNIREQSVADVLEKRT